ncbi:astacin [Oesophagostomum dentatum]|uniref:Metalloendopeptidase n=1 Tax=Oesophagostomum dentatum TaxID=61180 RepID=A0A0B1TKM6_OESDE|nr:astacin [Oesophagostomum dentatum]
MIKRKVLFDGDIVMTEERLRRIVNRMDVKQTHRRVTRWAYRDIFYPGTIWQTGVPYEFDSDLRSEDMCSSTVGRDTSQPKQPVYIGPHCYDFGITTHEIAHALGLFHHQQRYDRDEYVTFYPDNVDRSNAFNFAEIPPDFLDTYGLPYDVGSVMHYAPTE